MEMKTAIVHFQRLQQQEIDGAAIYTKIAMYISNESDQNTLLEIAKDEEKHAEIFGKYSGAALTANKIKITFFSFLARLFGYTFVIKILEKAEDKGIAFYRAETRRIPDLENILEDEERHEQQLLDMLDEDRLNYVGDIVLGMNDALVELTGSLAGYTLAMQDTKIIAMAGLITGISASLSMTASGYLSAREAGRKRAGKASAYTGIAYILTVAFLIIPFLLFPSSQYLWALVTTLAVALLIIAGFNFYISVTKERSFAHNFLQMAGISLRVAAVSFVIGIVVKNALGINL